MDTNATVEQFAQHLIRDDMFQEWEERRLLVHDLEKVTENLERTARWRSKWKRDHLPDLGPRSYRWDSEDEIFHQRRKTASKNTRHPPSVATHREDKNLAGNQR